ncbi:MAG: DUF11 domain-containing protein [Anaerolineales bacterium]|nr:DUF11 domain-containing protein [Anaerolineales bacterium]
MSKKQLLLGVLMMGAILTLSIIVGMPVINAAVPAGYSEFFVPGGDEQLWDILVDLDNYDPNNYPSYTLEADEGMHAVISIVAAADSTTIYYDHWEDGYGFDPADPAGTADEIVYLDEGEVQVFETSHIPIDPRGTELVDCGAYHNQTCYDGRDRFYAQGGSVTVSRAGWAESSGASTLYAVAWEVFPTKPWMTEYTIPVGEDLFGYPDYYRDFHRTYIIVEATNDGTEVTFDDPVSGVTGPISLDTGEVTQLYHFHAGTKVRATQPIQVQFIVGRNWQQSGEPARHYEVRGFTAVPEELWDNEYVVPVESYPSQSGDLDSHNNSDVYLYNPSYVDLTVSWEDSSGVGTFTIDPRETLSYSDGTGHVLPQDSGAYLHGSTIFWGIGTVDTESTDYDWGYSLIPVSSLQDEYSIGWAPSSLDTSTQGSPLFVAPVIDNTTVFVDFSPTDGSADARYTIDRLESQRIFDPDYNMTGSRVWATGKIAIVYGEDPETAGPGYNYLDLGYTTLPLMENSIDLVLDIVKTADPAVISPGAGQRVEFTLVVSSHDYEVDDVNVTDMLPESWSYVSNSTSIILPDGTPLNEAGSNFSSNGQELTWGLNLDMEPNEVLTIVFEAETTTTLLDCYSLNLAEATGVRGGQTFHASDQAFIYISDLRMDKTSSANGNAVYPGDTIQYTIVISNVGAADAADISLTDIVPEGATYVADSSWVTAPALASGTVRDEFNTVSFSNNDGTEDWAGNWYEISESDGASYGSVRVYYGRLRLDNHSQRYTRPGAWRQADLSGATGATLSFNYWISGDTEYEDYAVVQVSNNGSNWNTLEFFNYRDSGSVSYDISSYISSQTSVRFQIYSQFYGSDEYFNVDNVQIEFTGSGAGYTTVPGGDPPYIAEAGDNYTLSLGETMTVTFQVTVDEPPLVSEIVNTANVYSPGMCAPLSDTTRDPLGPMDYGDLPVGYRVTRIEYDGARHAVGTLYLGSSVDDEGNGQEDAAAVGDDVHGVNDDDGVTRDSSDLWTPGSSVDLYVIITGGSGYLAGWFDWNGDGEFGTGEMIDFGSYSAGSHVVTIVIPNNGTYATGDTLFARFRVYPSNPGTPTLTGYANNGEVEDYRWEFSSPTAVTIADMNVTSPSGSYWWSGWMMAAALMVTTVTVLMRQRKRKNTSRILAQIQDRSKS